MSHTSRSAARPLIDRAFLRRDAETVARDLLGATLAVVGADGVRRVRLVETEAYVGSHDAACHAARGRTARTAVMFGPAGHAYVYLVYGLHHMLNVVTGPDGDPQAVLLRAAEPLDGTAAPRACRGPGLLAAHLGITRADNGVDLCAGDGRADADARAWIEEGAPPERIGVSARIGVAYAGEWAGAPLRFFDAD
ncbi:MAG: DNA-3-methyladenine glycosylase, partial [Ardenticatenales bacterium]